MTENKIKALVIERPNLITASFKIIGTTPYVQHKFSKKAEAQILEKHQLGSKAKNKKTHKERDIQDDYMEAQHFTMDGKNGIPAPAFRSALISACRLCGFQMTKAKLSIFIEPDGFDIDRGTGLVFINGTPELNKSTVRLETGVCSIAIRPMWRDWNAILRITFDGDQFSHEDIGNLLLRAGLQVGIGEGRNDSKKSHGQGWGCFALEAG